MGRFLIFIYIFLEVGEQYDGTNIMKLSNNLQIKHCDVNFYHQTSFQV